MAATAAVQAAAYNRRCDLGVLGLNMRRTPFPVLAYHLGGRGASVKRTSKVAVQFARPRATLPPSAAPPSTWGHPTAVCQAPNRVHLIFRPRTNRRGIRSGAITPQSRRFSPRRTLCPPPQPYVAASRPSVLPALSKFSASSLAKISSSLNSWLPQSTLPFRCGTPWNALPAKLALQLLTSCNSKGRFGNGRSAMLPLPYPARVRRLDKL